VTSDCATLLHICARHAYFGEQAVTRFRFAPSPATTATLARLDIVTHVSAEGLTLVCPERTRIALRAGAEPALELEFQAWGTGTSFALVTALETPAADARLMFHSAQALREETGNWRLHAAPHADATAWSRACIPNRAAALADTDMGTARPAFHIVLSAPAIAAALAGAAAPRFLVRFGARQTKWKYYLLIDQFPSDLDADRIAIVDPDGVLSLTPLGYAELPGQRAALTFISDQVIDMRQHPPQRLQLCERDEPGKPVKRILIKQLPNASAATAAREVAAGSSETGAAILVSEIYVRYTGAEIPSHASGTQQEHNCLLRAGQRASARLCIDATA
jgi:hypothetical protein